MSETTINITKAEETAEKPSDKLTLTFKDSLQLSQLSSASITTASINNGYGTIEFTPYTDYTFTPTINAPNTNSGSSAGSFTWSSTSINNWLGRTPISVYTEEKVTKSILESYVNGSFIFDKATKAMIYKDDNGDIFIQSSFRKINEDDIERELHLSSDSNILQKEIEDYFNN